MSSALNRRDFLATAACLPFTTSGPSHAAETRPNIVMIMADDLGFSDIGCYGSEIRTPNLDRLARDGMRFTQFYNSARCCPTRAALLTGLYNHQAGVGDMVNDRGFPAYQGFLNDRCVTIAEALRPSGYHVLMSGKWHVGESRPHWPTDRGFERYFGLISGASNYYRLDEGRKMALEEEPFTPPPSGFYMTDAITDYAVKRIDEYAVKSEPFFLYVAYTAPHWPLHALPEDIERYRGKYMQGWDRLREERYERQLAMGIVEKRWPVSPRDPEVPAWETVSDKESWDLRMAVYAAQIDRMDQGIGRVLEAIGRSGRADNTLVLFLADNGGCHETNIRGENPTAPGPADSFTSYRRPWANASNTPFRMFKHWVHEGGISSPLIAHWPKAIRKKGSLCREPGHVIDLMATCVDLSGAQYPRSVAGREITPLAGKSLRPLFEGQKREGHAALFWEHEGSRAVRKGRMKLVSKVGEGWELYDIEADRSELENLAASRPETVKQLEAEYEAWASRCGVVPWEQVVARTRKN